MEFPKSNIGTICGVYAIQNIKSLNKFYIGSSKNIYNRWLKHRSLLRHNVHENIILQNTWNKYGEESFHWIILCTCSPEQRLEEEQKYLDLLKPYCNIEKHVSPGIIRDESQKSQISNTLKEGYLSGRIKPTRTRAIKVFDLKGNFIKSFNSINECSRELNLCSDKIGRVLSKKHKFHRGYQFLYLEDTNAILDISKFKRKLIYKNKIIINLITGIKYENVTQACIHLNLVDYNVRYHLRKYNFYKKDDIILTDASKPCEFRETPEVDNPEPSVVEIL